MSKEAETAELMRKAIKAVERILPGCALVVLAAPFNGPPGARCNYIGNGKREDIVVLMKEVIARFEGRAHDAPGGRQ